MVRIAWASVIGSGYCSALWDSVSAGEGGQGDTRGRGWPHGAMSVGALHRKGGGEGFREIGARAHRCACTTCEQHLKEVARIRHEGARRLLLVTMLARIEELHVCGRGGGAGE